MPHHRGLGPSNQGGSQRCCPSKDEKLVATSQRILTEVKLNDGDLPVAGSASTVRLLTGSQGTVATLNFQPLMLLPIAWARVVAVRVTLVVVIWATHGPWGKRNQSPRIGLRRESYTAARRDGFLVLSLVFGMRTSMPLICLPFDPIAVCSLISFMVCIGLSLIHI